ncbi:MAG: histidinol-phosphate transaminase [Candidatus Dactylopiibacterium carminicum]|uniref:Histidinol-phosphate aminotransferase n=1 Tax=Candidatus Dactylopiibacterium carminicum TaxID=857335 RepID=A0A272ENI1_9RHOO|nr:histidinol-phosphate transaminase [Candidatus Dactylopiibacterium carminicum]KAF7598082.1 histidinol-phosphate transaminase [Candidatus Dactylopiibacterium carminicum]PAS91677.1 MAG: histidinol-phosphate transaminase [Candidatus Dactylopiibacterium carminicum]PAS93690.1 MAG: histidinol-phosphate transaminase [Candidatus Dactylopiibacterium carminicum]PAS96568.1 MAG: histidinol-phosphate transaminase [Candidatus Dactylopiibacterium carminicum]
MSVVQRAPAHIRAISPYVPGKPVGELARELGLDAAGIVKLASNENPSGMSPRARAAVAAALEDSARYPDGSGFELKQVLATRLGVEQASLLLGNGSNDILELVARTFLGPETSAVYAQYAFAVYALAVKAVGARGIEVPARAWGHDLAAMADAITTDTRVVFIANPNNPTGSFLPAHLLEAFLMRMPAHVLVVLDEAYNEYLPPALRYDSLSWLAQFQNLLVVRTMSKIHGLAGLRVGYAVGSPAVVDLLDRVRQPFNVNSLAQAAAAAALEDEEFVRRSHELNRAGMAQILSGLRELNLESIPSQANFISFRVGDAAAVNRSLLQQGVIVRPLSSYGMPEWLRVSIGLSAENTRFLEALAVALKG